MTKSTRSRDKNKPPKPYPDFPLYAHATRRWAKKIKGKLYYFGPWEDQNRALERYLDQRDDLYAGRTPRVKSDGLVIGELSNEFLAAKQNYLRAGDIQSRTFRDYLFTCKKLVDFFGRDRLVVDLADRDFSRYRAKLSETLGPVALKNEISRARRVFKYAFDAGLIESTLRYGQGFKRPSKKTLRKERQANGPRMFDAEPLRSIIDTASQPLRAMVFLGINCAFGQTEIADLPKPALDLDRGWIDYPRTKTAIKRRCPLWPETIEALREAIKKRPIPKNSADGDLCFVTKYGNRWVRTVESEDMWKHGQSLDAVGHAFDKVLKGLEIKRKRVGFYALRHTFETIAGDTTDQVAVDHLMGHARDDMASLYRERISDHRLKAVVDHVRKWLFCKEDNAQDDADLS